MIRLGYDVDVSQIKGLRALFRASLAEGVEAVTKRGVVLVKEETPRGGSRRLSEGVSHRMKARGLRGEITVTALRPAEPAGTATLHLVSGKTREVPTRARPAFDYAQAVAEGTGLFGVKGQLIKPKRSRVLLIPVESVDPGESYLVISGQRYIFRRWSKGMKPNRYDERAHRRLEADAPRIVEAALAPLAV